MPMISKSALDVLYQLIATAYEIVVPEW